MDAVEILPGKLSGVIKAVPSKSFSHRAIICGALSGGKSEISNLIFSQDVLATINGVKELGANINICHDKVIINNFDKNNFFNKNNFKISIDCLDSGSTLRFLIPVISALGKNVIFKRSLNLSKRPILELLETLSKSGIKFKMFDDLSLEIDGVLKPGRFLISGNISSQFVSGLLMALPILKGDSEIKLTSKLKSLQYVFMTMDVMKQYGVDIKKTAEGFFIKGNQKYKPTNYVVEGDWSQAAFFMAAGAMGKKITITGLNKDSIQGDKKICEILSKFGADVSCKNGNTIVKPSKLVGINIDASDILDIVPVLSVVAASSKGETNITNIEGLKFKECDRLEAIYQELKCLGVDIKKTKSTLTILGKEKMHGGKVWSHNDHRMAMALSIMSENLTEKIIIINANCVKKSYPNFFEEFNLMGGKASVIDLGK